MRGWIRLTLDEMRLVLVEVKARLGLSKVVLKVPGSTGSLCVLRVAQAGGRVQDLASRASARSGTCHGVIVELLGISTRALVVGGGGERQGRLSICLLFLLYVYLCFLCFFLVRLLSTKEWIVG